MRTKLITCSTVCFGIILAGAFALLEAIKHSNAVPLDREILGTGLAIVGCGGIGAGITYFLRQLKR
jgi:hypothetical protein